MKIVFSSLTLDSELVKAQIYSMIESDCAPHSIILVSSDKTASTIFIKIIANIKNKWNRLLSKICSIMTSNINFPAYKSNYNFNSSVIEDAKLSKNEHRILSEFLSNCTILKVKSNINQDEYKNLILSLKPDLIVATMCGIVKDSLISLDIPIMNVHASKLPKYRGMNCIEWALWDGDEIFCTYHKMHKGIDEGDILFQHCIDQGERHIKGVSVNELRNLYFYKAFRNFGSSVKKYFFRELSFQPQNKEVLSYSQCYTMHKILKDKLHENLVKGQLNE